MSELTLDEVRTENFKRIYNNAVEQKKSIFVYKGHEITTKYAEILIQLAK